MFVDLIVDEAGQDFCAEQQALLDRPALIGGQALIAHVGGEQQRQGRDKYDQSKKPSERHPAEQACEAGCRLPREARSRSPDVRGRFGSRSFSLHA
jgi:hypothetical protein